MKRKLGLLALGLIAPLVMTACGSSDDSSSGAGDAGSGTGQITYWLWDSNQLPAYQKCADAFQTANPDVTIKIEQLGWNDYWTKLTTGFVSGTAPDVFTDHLQKYPEFASQGLLLPLDDLIKQDNVDLNQYSEGLADVWKGNDGKQYGLPKDFDTTGIFYNKAMATAAGVTQEQLATMEWNPTDGGTYEDVIAKLTIDNNGVRGDEPGFDKTNVKTYGLGLAGGGSGLGQTEYSMYTGSNGWTATDELWATKYNYDSPKFQETIAWWKSLIDKGYMPPLEKTVGAGTNQQFGAANYAMVTEGSWNTGAFTSINGVDTGIAPTPIGPVGHRASMYNGLADSIWSGSKNQAAAWKWVKFLGSADCQNIVGEQAVVFPAIPAATEKAVAAFQAKGIDVTPFTDQVKDGNTFLPPVTEKAAEVAAIMGPAMDGVMGGSADVSSLTDANTQVNALFQ